MENKKWTVTSPNGQVLRAEQEGGRVNMWSKSGNHGSYTLEQWDNSLQKMVAAGYVVTVEAV